MAISISTAVKNSGLRNYQHVIETMETLDGTEWDVVITDTGFLSALLALSLSRSGKRILHLDAREYYGGVEAALSLSEAEAWASRHFDEDKSATFSNASAVKKDTHSESKLASSRAYSITLAPHLIYARSNLVSGLVSSQCHNQLDFQAVGSWFLSQEADGPEQHLMRVPSSREDVFQDSTLGLKAKRSLMKFLRFVVAFEEQSEIWHDDREQPFPAFLEQKFGLPPASHGPILALVMSTSTPVSTSTGYALPRIARHLRSIGIFGPGFGAVLAKWGGLAEIVQVACRANAVGGGTYVLNKSIIPASMLASNGRITLELDDREKITTSWLCGSSGDLAKASGSALQNETPTQVTSKSISVISSALKQLFPPTSEGGVLPAGAVAVISSERNDEPSVNIFVHTSDAGECPMNQSIVYAAVALPHDQGYTRLQQAVDTFLVGIDEHPPPQVLWSMQYQQRAPSQFGGVEVDQGLIGLPQLPNDLVLDDSALNSVRQACQTILGDSEDMFMQFDARSGERDE